jgi:hypothetical protein
MQPQMSASRLTTGSSVRARSSRKPHLTAISSPVRPSDLRPSTLVKMVGSGCCHPLRATTREGVSWAQVASGRGQLQFRAVRRTHQVCARREHAPHAVRKAGGCAFRTILLERVTHADDDKAEAPHGVGGEPDLGGHRPTAGRWEEHRAGPRCARRCRRARVEADVLRLLRRACESMLRTLRVCACVY